MMIETFIAFLAEQSCQMCGTGLQSRVLYADVGVIYFLGTKMDLLSIALGFGVVGAAALIDGRGFDWAQRRVSETLTKEAMHQPMIRVFPSSRFQISLADSDMVSSKKI